MSQAQSLAERYKTAKTELEEIDAALESNPERQKLRTTITEAEEKIRAIDEEALGNLREMAHSAETVLKDYMVENRLNTCEGVIAKVRMKYTVDPVRVWNLVEQDFDRFICLAKIEKKAVMDLKKDESAAISKAEVDACIIEDGFTISSLSIES